MPFQPFGVIFCHPDQQKIYTSKKRPWSKTTRHKAYGICVGNDLCLEFSVTFSLVLIHRYRCMDTSRVTHFYFYLVSKFRCLHFYLMQFCTLISNILLVFFSFKIQKNDVAGRYGYHSESIMRRLQIKCFMLES